MFLLYSNPQEVILILTFVSHSLLLLVNSSTIKYISKQCVVYFGSVLSFIYWTYIICVLRLFSSTMLLDLSLLMDVK